MVDCDDTYPLEYARQMADKVLCEDSDMVVGDRLSSTYYQENKRPFHNMGNSLVKRSINFLFQTEIQDIMTGYRAFSYQFVKSFPVLSKGFEIETEMTIHAVYNNMQVDNVAVSYTHLDVYKRQALSYGVYPDYERTHPSLSEGYGAVGNI